MIIFNFLYLIYYKQHICNDLFRIKVFMSLEAEVVDDGLSMCKMGLTPSTKTKQDQNHNISVFKNSFTSKIVCFSHCKKFQTITTIIIVPNT